jgi:hypothetical protein
MDTPGIDWNHLEHWVYEKYEMVCEVESGESSLVIKG